MSYDLDFWKYKKDTYLDNQDTYEKCSDGYVIEGLESLPVESIINNIHQEFISWKMDESDIDFEDMNRIIDVMNKFDCPLYDPQVPQRYDGK